MLHRWTRREIELRSKSGQLAFDIWGAVRTKRDPGDLGPRLHLTTFTGQSACWPWWGIKQEKCTNTKNTNTQKTQIHKYKSTNTNSNWPPSPASQPAGYGGGLNKKNAQKQKHRYKNTNTKMHKKEYTNKNINKNTQIQWPSSRACLLAKVGINQEKFSTSICIKSF